MREAGHPEGMDHIKGPASQDKGLDLTQETIEAISVLSLNSVEQFSSIIYMFVFSVITKLQNTFSKAGHDGTCLMSQREVEP